MKTLTPFTLSILLCSSLSIANNQFNEQHKINNSYIKVMAKAKSKRGDSSYIKIKNKKELKEAIKNGKLESKHTSKGSKFIYTDIRNVHITQRDLKELAELNIGSNIKGDGKVIQTVNIKNSRFDTNKHITVGVKSTANRRGSITSVTNIENSQLGKR